MKNESKILHTYSPVEDTFAESCQTERENETVDGADETIDSQVAISADGVESAGEAMIYDKADDVQEEAGHREWSEHVDAKVVDEPC